jgi:hypothetical protein
LRLPHLTRPFMPALFVGALASVTFAQSTQSPIPEHMSLQPQIDISGTGIATLDFGRQNLYGSGGLTSGSQINFSDSSLGVSFSQRMFGNGIGSFTLSGLSLDQSNSGNSFQFFLNQAFLDYQSLRYEVYIGRTDNPSAQLVQFPTLRGDDLVEFTYLTDPFSNGKNIEEQRYSNVASVTFNQNLRNFENVHVQHLIDSDNVNGSNDSMINSAGIGYQYLVDPTDEQLARLPSYGAGFEYRSIPESFGGSSEALYAGGKVNVSPSLTHPIDLNLLDTFTFGNSLSVFQTVGDTFRANANAVAASLRYSDTPFGKPPSSLALTAGFKSFGQVSGASEFGLELTGTKGLGQGFDAVAQLGYLHRSDAFSGAYAGNRDGFVLQLGLSFNFSATINNNIGARRTPLNTLYHHDSN